MVYRHFPQKTFPCREERTIKPLFASAGGEGGGEEGEREGEREGGGGGGQLSYL